MTIMEHIFATEKVYYVEQYDSEAMVRVEQFNNFFEALHYAQQFKEALISPENGDYIWFSGSKNCNTAEQAAMELVEHMCDRARVQQWFGGGDRIRRDTRNARRMCANNHWWRRVNRGKGLPF